MNSLRLHALLAILLALGSQLLANPAAAQNYPNRPIRIVVPYPPGGSTDALTRFAAERLAVVLGTPVVVDNKPGASSVIGVDSVAKSPADGYTLGVVNTAFVANPSLMKKLPYDTERDFAPITTLSTSTLVFAGATNIPAKTLKEFVALAKSKPSQLFYASGGTGTGGQLMNERFNYLAGIKMTHVPYKGGGAAVLSVVSGETSLMLASIQSVLPQFQAGKAIPLAVGSKTRSPALPNVPTISEEVLPGFEAVEWIGVVAPAGTPPTIITRLHDAFAKVLMDSEIKTKFLAQGADPFVTSPADFSAFISKEIVTWAEVIKRVGITLD